MSASFDVLGVGHAIVDVIAQADDALLVRNALPKGAMTLMDETRISRLYNELGHKLEMSGGSVANTMAGIASFGGSVAFAGTVGHDRFGELFAQDLRALGITYATAACNTLKTGCCLVLVTPDHQRTLNTCLGASTTLSRAHIAADTVAAAKLCYLEGYLWDGASTCAAAERAAQLARQAGRKVALSLSDPLCVARHRPALLKFIEAFVDVLLANKAEICALYETTSFSDAREAARRTGALCALTRDSRGSLIVRDDQTWPIEAGTNVPVVDVTGAGDLYAAGFLFGHANGKSPPECGQLGTIAATRVIAQMGARLQTPLKRFSE